MKARIDAQVVDARLREFSRRLRRIEAKRPASLKQLAADEDLQDIVSHNLELAIQACTDIAAHLCGAHGMVPPTAGEAFSMLAKLGLLETGLAKRLRRAVGFRNVLVHEYVEVDWKIVLRVITADTKDLAAFGKAVVALLEA
ncbi:MAG: type VII toxin-antitoxin system HepT family RNase toxin [Burkholderiales bacterium]